jgi:protein TonB
MLHPFVSSPTGSRRNLAPVLALSAAVHVGLLVAAIKPVRSVHLTHVPEAVAEVVHYTALPFRAVLTPASRTINRGRRGGRVSPKPKLKLPQMLVLNLDLPEAAPLPEYLPDYTAVDFIGTSGLANDVLHLGLGSDASKVPAGAPYNSYDELAVEKRVVPVAENPKPHYPTRMLNRGIETNFNVYFVVDTTGTVDKETVELPPSIQQEFTRAVAEVLFIWRFVPAELGGRRVRQRVLQPFSFRVEGQYGSRRP